MSYFPSFPANLNSGVVRTPVFRLIATWRERVRARRRLAQLDDRQLRDIGVSPADIQREILKPFWSE